MISTEYRCVFVHVPKTAGTSICISLGWIDGKDRTYGAQDHRSISEIREAMRPVDFNSYFKFAFVRNPWDRVVSWYKNLREDPLQSHLFGVPTTCSLRDLLTVHNAVWGLQPQLGWIREPDGTVPLDFVGRYENIQRDYARVCERIGVLCSGLPQRAGADDRRPYTDFYDAETRSMVASRYAEEIELFDYKYGA